MIRKTAVPIRRIMAAACLLMTVMLTVANAFGEQAEAKMCWSAIVAPSGARNFLLLCVNDKRISILTFFGNPGAKPTICRQAGNVVNQTAKRMELKSENGLCENSMAMASSAYDCRFLDGERLECIVDGGVKLIFRRESRRLYEQDFGQES